MAYVSVNPVSGSLVARGDTITVTWDTATLPLITYVPPTGPSEVISSPAAISATIGSGYTGEYGVDGSDYTIAFKRDAGWPDASFIISMYDSILTSTAQVNFVVMVEGQYPPDMQPFTDPVEGVLSVTEDSVAIEVNTGVLEFDAATFNVTNPANGRARVVGTTAGGSPIEVEDDTNGVLTFDASKFLFDGSGVVATKTTGEEITITIPGGGVNTLDDTITTGTPDNNVIVPAANPVTFHAETTTSSPLRIIPSASPLISPIFVLGQDGRFGLGVSNTSNTTATDYGADGISYTSGGSADTFAIDGGVHTSTTLLGSNVSVNAGDTNHATSGNAGQASLTGGSSLHNSSSSDGGAVNIGGGVANGTGDGGWVTISGGSSTGGTNGGISLGPSFTSGVYSGVPVYIREQAAASTDLSTYGQIWTRTSDGHLIYTDDGGTTTDLVAGVESATSLDALVNVVGTTDNDVNIPAADPIIFRDGAGAITPLTIVKLEATQDAFIVETVDTSDVGIRVRNTTDAGTWTTLGPSALYFGQNPAGYGVVQSEEHLWLNAAADLYLTSSGGLIGVGTFGAAPSEIEFQMGFTVGEGTDHPVAPVAAKAQYWVKSAAAAGEAQNRPYFTADDGTDYDLTISTDPLTLDQVINDAPQDNTVAVPSSNPVIFTDGAVAGLTPLTISKTSSTADIPAVSVAHNIAGVGVGVANPTTGHTLNISAFGAVSAGDYTGDVTFGGGSAATAVPGTAYFRGKDADDTVIDAGDAVLVAGDSTHGTPGLGGDVLIDPGTGSTPGDIKFGTSQAPNEIVFAQGFTILEASAQPLGGAQAGKGQFWVNDATSPNKPYYTDEDGASFDLTIGSGVGDVTATASLPDNALVRGDGGVKGVQADAGSHLSDVGDLVIANDITSGNDLISSGDVTVGGRLDMDAGGDADLSTGGGDVLMDVGALVDGRDVSVDGGVLDGHVATVTGNPHAVEGLEVLSTGEAGALVLTTDGADGTTWSSTGVGDVTAGATVTDNTIVRGDGGVKGVQESGVLISDTDQLSRVTQIVAVDTVAAPSANFLIRAGNAISDDGGHLQLQTGLADNSGNIAILAGTGNVTSGDVTIDAGAGTSHGEVRIAASVDSDVIIGQSGGGRTVTLAADNAHINNGALTFGLGQTSTVNPEDNTGASPGDPLTISGGTATLTAQNGGDLTLRGGGTLDATEGDVVIGDVDTTAVTLGATGTSVDVVEDLTVAGDLTIVGVNVGDHIADVTTNPHAVSLGGTGRIGAGTHADLNIAAVDAGNIFASAILGQVAGLTAIPTGTPAAGDLIPIEDITDGTWKKVAASELLPDAATVTGPGASVLSNAIATYDGTGGLTVKESEVLVNDASAGTGARELGATAVLAGGQIQIGGTISASGDQAIALGSAIQTGGTASVNATGLFSIALAHAECDATATSAIVTSGGPGTIVMGGVAASEASSVSTMNCAQNSDGSVIMGTVTDGDLEITGSRGAVVMGDVGPGGSIKVTSASGAHATGSTSGPDSSIHALAGGSMAHGIVAGGSVISTTANGTGGLAYGRANTSWDITVDAAGGVAFGSATTADIKVDTGAVNSMQLGEGTNNVAGSLQVGDTTDGLRLISGGTTSTVNGSFWVDGTGNIIARSGGANIDLTTGAGGDVSGGSASVANELTSYSTTGGKTIGRTDFLIGSGSPTVGVRNVTNNASLAGGFIDDSGGSEGRIEATANGAVAIGASKRETGATAASILASGVGSSAYGYVHASVASSSGLITAAGAGSLVQGVTDESTGITSTLSSGSGATGSYVGGNVGSGGTVTGVGAGSFTHGQATVGGTVTATAAGSFAAGICTQSGTLGATGTGSVAFGRAHAAGSITAGGNHGALAGGRANVNDITASGTGSIAWGYANGTDIIASGESAVQIGQGTNVENTSLQVGDIGSGGVRLIGDGAAAASPQNGDMRMASAKLRVRDDGIETNVVSTLSKTLTLEDPVAESMFFFYTPVAITLTQVRALIQGGTSIPVTVASGTTYLTVVDTNVNAQTASNTTTGADLTIADATVAAGNVWITFGTPVGTQTLGTITVVYTED